MAARKTPKSDTKAAVYLRISSDTTGEELGVDRQREDCEQLCATRGWNPAHYTDNDISAKVANKRPAFKQMLADIEAGQISTVVAWSLDRLTRNARDRLAMVEACREHGVTIALVQGSDMDPTTASGRMVIGVLGEVAQMEIDQKAERQIRASRQRAELGRVWTPFRLFGYTMPNPDGTGMELHPEEAAVLRAAYTAVLTGQSMMGLSREWNAQGFTTGRNKPYTPKVVRNVLLNPRNAGIKTYRGKEIGKADWPAIVDEDVYRGVAAILTDPGRVRPPTMGRYLLSGIALCGKCGHTLSGKLTRNAKEPRPNYVCKECRGIGRCAADVDGWVIAHVVRYLARPDTLALTAPPKRPGQSKLRLKKQALLERHAALKVALADPDMPLEAVKEAAAEIKAKLDAINAELADANTTRIFAGVLPDEGDRNEFYALPMGERTPIAQARFDALTEDRQRALIDALVTVTVLPGQPSRGNFRTDLVVVQPKGRSK
jgi:DNA invertase Pin-like site-specific DNA recombinase